MEEDERILQATTWEIHYEVQPVNDRYLWKYSISPSFPDEPSALDVATNFFAGKEGFRNVEVVEVVRTVRWVMPSPTEEGRVVLQSEIDEWKVRQ